MRFCANINITVGFISLIFVLLVFKCFNFYTTKPKKNKTWSLFCCTRCKLINCSLIQCISQLLLVKLFYSGNRPVLLLLSFILYGNHTVFELKLVLGLWCGHKYYCWPIILKPQSWHPKTLARKWYRDNFLGCQDWGS